MTDLYIVVWLMILTLITMPGMALALTLLLPGITERAAQRIDRTPFASFIVGAIILAVAAGVGLGLASLIAPAIGAVVGTAVLGVYALGAAGMSRVFGMRLADMTFNDERPVRDVVVGGIALELACFVPMVGWFVLFPLVLAINTGAAAFALVGWSPREKTASQDRAVTQAPQPTIQLENV